jgi:hypothetical protein
MISILATVAFVRALALPVGFTVDTESTVPEIALGRDGTVAAIAKSTDRTYRVRALRWTHGATNPEVFVGLSVSTTPDALYDPNRTPSPGERVDAAGVSFAGDQLLVTASTSWGGAYSGTSYEVQRWGSYSAARWSRPQCVDSGDSKDQHAYGSDRDGNVALTIDRTGIGSFEVMQAPERYAPYAFVVRGSACRNLGRGVVQAVRGQWAAGYRGYLDGKLAPDNLNTMIQKIVAARWSGRHLGELGAGDALAIDAAGVTVGADAMPGQAGCMSSNWFSSDHTGKTYCPAVPHAVAWDSAGRRIALAPDYPRSVAYAISDGGTIVGTLYDKKRRHFAFRWRAGRLQRLDDLPHAPGWRFESAYAVDDDGSIAGIGTLHGIATVFVWRSGREV